MVERWGLKPSERCEVLVQGGDALELLRAFIANQREVLRLWIVDVAAQVNEKLAEKYPGEDLTASQTPRESSFSKRVTEPRNQAGRGIEAHSRNTDLGRFRPHRKFRAPVASEP